MDDHFREPPPHVVPVEESLDLHTFSPRDVVSVVEEYLEAAAGKRYLEVRLIHGKGKGVQRSAVRALLARHPLVESYSDAPAEAGGWGATRVTLKLPRDGTAGLPTSGGRSRSG